MEISLDKSSFLKIVQSAQRASSNKSTLPALNGIFLEASKEKVSAYSTDLEISIKDEIKATVKEEGKAVVSGNLLLEILKNMKEGKVLIISNKDKSKLIIKSGKVEFKVNTIKPEDYPPFPQTKEGKKISVKGVKLIEAIRQTLISVSRDETRPVLTGILFETSKDGVKIISTDSYRLSLKRVGDKDGEIQERESFVVPRRGVEEIAQAADKGEMINLVFSDNQVVFKTGGLVFVSRLMGGQYPNTQQLFPNEEGMRVEMDKEELLGAVKRIALVSPSTPVKISIGDGELVIKNESAEAGSGREMLKIDDSTSKIEISFNSKYLIDGLSAISGPRAVLEMIDSSRPVLIKGTKTKDYTHLIMPVRLN